MSRNIFLSIEYITLDRLDTSIYAGLIRSDVVMTMECAPRLREENIQRNLDLTRRIAHSTPCTKKAPMAYTIDARFLRRPVKAAERYYTMLDITTPRPAGQALAGTTRNDTLREAATILRQAADGRLSDAWECPPDLAPILGGGAWTQSDPAQIRQAAAILDAAQAALGSDERAVRRALLKAQQMVATPPLALPPALDTLLMMDTDPPPSDDVLPGLPAGAVGLLAGMGGIGKSWTFLGLAAAVAGGQTPFGSESGWDTDPGTPGAVLYIAAEDKADVLHRRLRALRFTRWASPWIRQVAQDISIVSLVGSAVPRLTLLDQPGRWDPPAIRDDTVGAIVTAARQIQARLIILDPLRRFHRLDENDNAAMDLMVEALERIATETGAAVLVGHPR